MAAPANGNGYAARLDGHDRELGQARDDRRRIWERVGKQGDRITAVEITAQNDREDIVELSKRVNDGFDKIASGQRRTINWLIATTFTGLGLIFTGISVVLALTDHI
jgi:hypothetical protein